MGKGLGSSYFGFRASDPSHFNSGAPGERFCNESRIPGRQYASDPVNEMFTRGHSASVGVQDAGTQDQPRPDFFVARPSERPKHKELEKIDPPSYPEITKLLLWKTSLVRSVIIASNNPNVQSVVDWLQEIWTSGTYESLRHSREFVTLDMKLAQAMIHMMNRAGEKGKRYREKSEPQD